MTFGAITTRKIRSGFYALRLHEAGLIQSSPRQLIAEHTDWRFVDEAQTRAEGLRLQEWEDTNVYHADAAPLSDYPFIGRCRRPRTPSARAG
jgi:hypothetical protein